MYLEGFLNAFLEAFLSLDQVRMTSKGEIDMRADAVFFINADFGAGAVDIRIAGTGHK